MSAAAVPAPANDGVSEQFRYQTNPAICRYFLRGICRFGEMCRFSHGLTSDDTNASNNPSTSTSTSSSGPSSAKSSEQPMPSTSGCGPNNWINAPVFVPGMRSARKCDDVNGDDAINVVGATTSSNAIASDNYVSACTENKSWAEIVSKKNLRDGTAGTKAEMCPYETPCPFGECCVYTLHYELCKMCDKFCLHPNDQVQRRQHNKECLQLHEQAMEFSFAIARSKDKSCGICFDLIMEKTGREKRFGILPNCSHIFCLECIRKWRQAKQFEHKITRSCPECRVSSDFVCPSAFWVETKEQKDKLLGDYRAALNKKDCKYFKKGVGKCPFGNKCFYKHALVTGELVDVGNPKRTRKLRSSSDEFIDLLDLYLWDFVDRRDYQWLDLVSSSNDDSDDSDYYDYE